MSASYILAIDQGTTNTKALLVGRDGRPVFRASTPVGVNCPRPGWVEQDAVDLWNSVIHVIGECLAWTSQRDGKVEGVSISNQRETIVAWTRDTTIPVTPAVVWQCRRSIAVCDRLAADHREEMLRERTGLGIDPLYSASKMQWLLQNVAGLREQASAGDICFGTIDSWLIANLTQGRHHFCDVSNAARTQLLSLSSADWDEDLLALFEVPRSTLPAVKMSSGNFGECAGIPGLEGVPIVSAMGDSHAAMVGHACFSPGSVKATYGTGSSLMTLLSTLPQSRRTSKLATTIAWGLTTRGVQYALEGNVAMAGSAVQWVGEFLGFSNPIEDALALAATVKGSDGVFFVPAMLGLGAPYWDTAAQGTITGLSRTSSAAHLAKAAIEAIAFQVTDVFHAMVEESGCDLPALHTDGGATRNSELMQFQSDILRRPVVRSAHEDLSALGTAWFGGLSLGWWSKPEDLLDLRPATQTFRPWAESSEAETRYAGWKFAVKRARLREAHA
jgi:glycerol kinase